MAMLKALWAYRGFILSSVKRYFQAKYRSSLLGSAWMVLNPLAMIVIYTVIFSHVMRTRMPGVESKFSYSIYLCAGLLTWELFLEIVSRGQNVFLENANFIKKINFPRLCLPTIVVINAVVNFAIIFSLFLLFLIFTGNFPGWVIFTAIPVLLLQIAFSIGLGTTFGILHVFFRDVGHFLGIAMTFWFWLTPIVYPVAILPENVRDIILTVNPMASIIGAYQKIFVHGQPPDWPELIITALLTLFICLFTFLLFRKRAGEMVDEL